VEGLKRNAGALLRIVGEKTHRIWLLYTAGSAEAFRRGDIAVYQVLLSRPDRGKSGLPLTRDDWYRPNSHESSGLTGETASEREPARPGAFVS
jgi:cyclopropane-fatty-acyl-phospholipid synthase